MIRFKDYLIKHKPETKFFVGKSENAEDTLNRINQWVEENEHIVLNIETLFVPELSRSPKGTGSAVFLSLTEKSEYHQVFRVWYKQNSYMSESKTDEVA